MPPRIDGALLARLVAALPGRLAARTTRWSATPTPSGRPTSATSRRRLAAPAPFVEEADRVRAPRDPFQYAIVRVVPRVERGECLNVGVVLLCRSRRFLGARIALDERRLAAFAPDLDPADRATAPRCHRADRRR